MKSISKILSATLKILHSDVISKQRICLAKGCEEFAINSHVLQKNGILNKLSDDKKHLYQLDYDIFKNTKFYFKYKGVNEVLTFKGFCNKHDTSLFAEIEKQNFKLSHYQVALLFTYRAMMMERRKKLNNIEWYQAILTSTILRDYIDKDYYFNILEQEKLGIADGEYYENIFMSNIEKPWLAQFTFITREIEFIEICASAVYTYETTHEINKMIAQEDINLNQPLTEIYFHLIPCNGKTTVLMGCLNERKPICWNYILQFINCSDTELLKKISTLLLKNVETWACSPNFYIKYFKPKENKIINIIDVELDSLDERKELNFNLFN